MKLALALAATIGSAAACGIDTADPAAALGGTPDPSNPTDPTDPTMGTHPGGDPGTGPLPVTEVSGRISANTTWKDAIHVTATVTIDANVTVTVLPGTIVDVATAANVTVNGTLDVQGTKTGKVIFESATAGLYWGDTRIPRGGALKASYLVQAGGGISVGPGGSVTVINSRMSHAGGDFLVMSGGTLDVSYSTFGVDPGQTDTTHCDLHVSGPVTLKVTHSNISSVPFGIMFYGGTGADFTYNNWFGNSIDIDTNAAYPVTGNFSFGYFAKGAPTKAGLTATNLATAPLADAGPQ